MANPILNDKSFNEVAETGATSAGWAAPRASTQRRGDAPYGSAPRPDGPISEWHAGVMTVSGTASATGVLFVLLLAAAVVGWQAVTVNAGEVIKFPVWTLLGILVGFGSVLAMRFKPQFAKVLGPICALGEGVFIGAISHTYETYQKGIVIQAAGATIGVFAVMLFLYRTNIIKVTDRMRRIVVGATLGIMVFYGISMLINLFGGSVGFLHSTSALSIGFSFLVAGLAAFNLALDFDFIERGAKAGMPKQMEWVGAVGLLVTIVWLYLEILRLLSKLNRR
jgi:uncharacterized YccA/Bax inhibitor family protein